MAIKVERILRNCKLWKAIKFKKKIEEWYYAYGKERITIIIISKIKSTILAKE